MAVTIVVETGAGLTTSNSYLSNADADTYNGARLYAEAWMAATEVNQSIALVWATRLLDENVDWDGIKTDADQVLEWPRYEVYDKNGFVVASDAVPTFLKNATAELARMLLEGDLTAEDDTKGFSRIKAGEVELDIDKFDRKGIIPRSVAAMLRPFGEVKGGSGAKTVSLLRA